MEHKITLDGNERYLVLETIITKNNRFRNRKETNDEQQIHNGLNILIPGIKTIKELDDGTIEISIPEENATLTISNYNIIKNYDALSEINECIKNYDASQEINEYTKNVKYPDKRKKRISTCATIFALSATAIAAISSRQKDNEDIPMPLKIKAEALTEHNLEDEITILNSDNLLYASPKEIDEVETLEMIVENTFDFNLQDFISEIGSKKDDARKQNVESEYGALTEKYALITGIDQELIECLLSQERGFHSSEKDAGGAIGVAQIQVNHHEGEKLYLRNELTGKTESFIVTTELIKDLEGNIKTCATLLQNKLDYYNGNTLVALQSYNFGYGAMDKVIENTSKETGKTIAEIINDPMNLEWMNYTQAYSDQYETRNGYSYGDPSYIKNVMSFYNEDEFTIQYNKSDDNKTVTINYLENEKSHGL